MIVININKTRAVFAGRLRDAREQRGLKQSELERLLDCPLLTVSRYETMRGEPDLERLAQLAAVLSVSVDYLLGLEGGADE